MNVGALRRATNHGVTYSNALRRNGQQVRGFYMWLNYVFNRKDEARANEIGPDRTAAEWIIRNGGAVKFSRSSGWLKSYNTLPMGPNKEYCLTEIDATGTSLTDNGFDHLVGLEHLQHLNLNGCKYISNIAPLEHVKGTLVHLDLGNCQRVSDVAPLVKLTNLKMLILTGTLGRGREEEIQNVEHALPECTVVP